MSFLIRILSSLFLFAIFAGLLLLVVMVVLRIVKFVAVQLGYEVGSFSRWIGSLFPKRKRRKKKGDGMHSPPSISNE